MSKRKLKSLRIFAAFMLISILNQLFFPTVSYALTSLDTQPEVFGYQPVDATDNVSLVSGKFNYTIPITSIPEFPMAIGYNAGMGMEQEAGVFGFGFNGFSGAISRTVNGLPDDLNGNNSFAGKLFTFSSEPIIDANLKTTFELGYKWGDIGAGVSTSQIYGFNNYSGMYGAISMGLSGGYSRFLSGSEKGEKDGGMATLGIAVEFMNDSRESAPRFGAGAGLSIGTAHRNSAGEYSGGQGSVSLAGIYAGKSLDNNSKWQTGGSALNGLYTFGKSNFATKPAATSSALPNLAYVFPRRGGTTVSMNTGSLPFCFCSFATLWSKFKFFSNVQRKRGFGYMYLDKYNRASNERMADMAVEGEDSFDKRSYNNPSYLQKDGYSINTMGLAGGMELYQRGFGEVSRNYTSQQTNKRNTYSVKSEIKSVNPWYSAKQLSMNEDADILSVLSSAASTDFEVEDLTNAAYVLFEEKDRQDFSNARRFKSDPVFKMRGDYAGEYDLASGSFDDHEVNAYSLLHISGTSSDAKLAWIGVEKNVPLYYPQSADFNTSPGTIKTSTHIKKNKIGDILLALSSVSSAVPGPGTGVSTSPSDPFNFSQSFYTNYTYERGSETKGQNVVLNDHLANENSLKHLSDLRTEALVATSSAVADSYFNDLIGSFEVQSVNGLRYYFNLPAFNKTTKSIQLSGKGANAPVSTGGDYFSLSRDMAKYDRNKVTVEDTYMYPYAWMLTAIVGDDYIDFDNVPGPSDGDLGYWVKFKYTRAADNYKWRTPFTGMDYLPGLVHKFNDDSYTVMYGEKEIYYLAEIESSNYICKYTYEKRFDAVDAASYVNGDAFNTLRESENFGSDDRTGDNFQFAVTQIDLYKKHTEGANSTVITNTSPKIIKSTKFYYDYSTCRNLPNNYQKYSGSIHKADLPYHIDYDPATDEPTSDENIETGKLTLRKVQHIAYDESGDIATASYLPSYKFTYYGDENKKYNPDYDRNCLDHWGNYMNGAKDKGENDHDGIDYYEHYTEYVKSEADENAKVFKLKTIKLPSGGSMEINYEAQSYGYVEDKTPYVMRHVTAVSYDDSETDRTWLTVDVTDLGGGGLEDTKYTNAAGDQVPILSRGEKVYGELCFYRSPESDGAYKKEGNTIVVGEEAIVDDIESSISTVGDRSYQRVRLHSQSNDDYMGDPFIAQAKLYLYHESDEAHALNDQVGAGCPNVQSYLEDIQTMDRDTPGDAIRKIIAHGNHMLNKPSDAESNYNGCFGDPFAAGLYAHWSFLRTPIYKAKYTGAAVSSIKLRDGFNYATQADGTANTTENEYGTNYFYDLKGDGTATSAGVATIEPGGGKSCVIDVLNTKGSGFRSFPQIISSRTTLENLYHADGKDAAPGDRISRNKGKTSYEFYTPKDDGLQFGDNFKVKHNTESSTPITGHFFLYGIINWVVLMTVFGVDIKIPKFIPIVLHWKMEDRYHTRAYAYTDYTDIFGRLKNIHQVDATGQEIGSQSYNYYGIDEAVPVYNKSFTSTDASDKKPGKMDQAWAEAFYSRTDNLQSIPPLFLLNAKSQKEFCYTGMKYSYIPPVLKEVVSTIDGLTTTTKYTGFDYYTGSPIEARSKDSYNNEKISRTVPAYWKYTEMGPRSENDNYVNNLTASTGSYMYLNSVSDANLIGAGVVQWSRNDDAATWGMISYVQPKREFVSSSSYKYVYKELAGSDIMDEYNPTERGSDKYVKRNAYLYKTYKGYTYEVPLNSDGTGRFQSFTAFSYTGSNPAWKELSTNELYSEQGVLVQSKDVLSKYASQLLGYNFSNTIAAVSNSSWGACAYEGAENTYATTAGALMLENNKVKLDDATVLKACERTFDDRTLTTASFPHTGPLLQARVVNVTLPTIPAHNVPFAKVDIVYSGTGIARQFYISLNDDNKFQVMSNVGETFDGFFVYPQPGGSYKLLFLPSDFSSFTLDNAFTAAGYTVTSSLESGLKDCELSKPYQVPENDCGYVHTGSYAFSLAPGGKGTSFLLSANTGGNVTTAEFKRKYKALVWVHNTSPLSTELVMQVTDAAGSTLLMPELKTSRATPYAVAGEWSLLRLDFNLSNLHVTGDPYVHVFVRNASANTYAVYDDYRVLPFNADMTNWVFDHKFNRVVSGLDVDNFASYSAYDSRGRVIESKVELQDNGKKTVQKFLYNDQKKN